MAEPISMTSALPVRFEAPRPIRAAAFALFLGFYVVVGGGGNLHQRFSGRPSQYGGDRNGNGTAFNRPLCADDDVRPGDVPNGAGRYSHWRDFQRTVGGFSRA